MAARPMVRRLAITLALALAVGLVAVAGSVGGGNPGNPSSEEVAGGAVEFFLPADDSPSVPVQGDIGVDLAAGWSASLQIDGLVIPSDQLNCRDDCFERAPGARRRGPRATQQDLVFFVPGPGKVIERLAAGTRCATAVVWRTTTETEAGDGRPARWCFRVV